MMNMANDQDGTSCDSGEMEPDARAPLKPDAEREIGSPGAEDWMDAVLRKARHTLLSLQKFTR